jgi:hypothetical protein
MKGRIDRWFRFLEAFLFCLLSKGSDYRSKLPKKVNGQDKSLKEETAEAKVREILGIPRKTEN